MNYFDFHTHKKKHIKSIINLFHYEKPDDKYYYSLGIHPWHINNNTIAKDFKSLEETSQHPNIIAIGECGFDKNIKSNIKDQTKVFEKHIEISENQKKPLIIHCVGYYDELIKNKRSRNPSQIWVIHGLNKNKEVFRKFIDEDFYFSIGYNLIKNHDRLKEILKIIPFDKFFIETDDNEVFIEELYSKVATVLSMSVEDLAKTINLSLKKCRVSIQGK